MGGVGWGGGDRLCQTSPIPKSPDGDKKKSAFCHFCSLNACAIGGFLGTNFALVYFLVNTCSHTKYKKYTALVIFPSPLRPGQMATCTF